MVGNISSKLISFLLLPLYTHYLSTEAYGESDVISVYASITLALTTCCIADGMFVFPKNENDEGKKRYFSSGLVFVFGSFILIALALLCIDSFVAFSYNSVLLRDKWWIYMTALSMFLQEYTQQFTLSLEKMICYSATGVVLTVLTAILAIILLPCFGLLGFLWSIIGANIGSAIFSFFFSKSYKFLSFQHVDNNHIKSLLGYGIPLIPNSIMWWLVSGLNRPLMETYLGMSAIGLFSVANRFPSVLTMVFQILGKGMSITVIEEFHKKDFNFFYNRILRILTSIIMLMGVMLSMSSKLIIDIFTDASYASAWRYMPLLTLAVIFQCMGSFIGSIFVAEKNSKYFFYSSFWAALTSLLLTYICIRYFGIFGVCFAVVGSFLTMFVTRLRFAWKHINLFDLKYYAFLFFFYVIIVVIVTLECSIGLQCCCYIIYTLIIYYLNKNDIVLLISRMKSLTKLV